MNDKANYFEKIRLEVIKEAGKAHKELWDKYAESYKLVEKQLEDTNLTQAERRELTRMFDRLAWSKG